MQPAGARLPRSNRPNPSACSSACIRVGRRSACCLKESRTAGAFYRDAKLILGDRLNTPNSIFRYTIRPAEEANMLLVDEESSYCSVSKGRPPLQALAQRIRRSVWWARRSGRLEMEAGAEVGRRSLIQRVQCSWNCAGGGAAPTSDCLVRLVPMPSLPARVRRVAAAGLSAASYREVRLATRICPRGFVLDR